MGLILVTLVTECIKTKRIDAYVALITTNDNCRG